jgi:pyridoxal 5'-phosphate synthase pdxS subunit
MIRTKGEAGSGNIVEAVKHMRTIVNQIKKAVSLECEELMKYSKQINAPYSLLEQVKDIGKLPVPNFSAGGIATPADAALMMQLGAEAVFVGSGIFTSDDPDKRAVAIVKATTYYNKPKMLAEISTGLKSAMKGLDISEIPEYQLSSTILYFEAFVLLVFQICQDLSLHS